MCGRSSPFGLGSDRPAVRLLVHGTAPPTRTGSDGWRRGHLVLSGGNQNGDHKRECQGRGFDPAPDIIGSLGSPIDCRGVFMFVLRVLPWAGSRSDAIRLSWLQAVLTFDISKHLLRLTRAT